MREATNVVHIEGYISSVDLKVWDNEKGESISGYVKIKTGENSIHNVKVSSNKINKNGQPSKVYKELEKVMNYEKDQKVRVSNGKMTINDFINDEGELISYSLISSNFFNKVSESDKFTEQAKFRIECVVDKTEKQSDGRLKLDVFIPVYDNKVIPFSVIVPENKGMIEYVNENFKQGKTVYINGDIVNISKTETITTPAAFGEDLVEEKTTTIKEYIVVGGMPPLSGDEAYDVNDIKEALDGRKRYLSTLVPYGSKQETKHTDPFDNNDNKSDTQDPFYDDGKPIDISDDDLPW